MFIFKITAMHSSPEESVKKTATEMPSFKIETFWEVGWGCGGVGGGRLGKSICKVIVHVYCMPQFGSDTVNRESPVFVKCFHFVCEFSSRNETNT